VAGVGSGRAWFAVAIRLSVPGVSRRVVAAGQGAVGCGPAASGGGAAVVGSGRAGARPHRRVACGRVVRSGDRRRRACGLVDGVAGSSTIASPCAPDGGQGVARCRAVTVAVARRAASSWLELAACRGRDPRWWFAHADSFETAVARSICARCPVRQPCLADALAVEAGADVRYVYGLRGGLTGAERVRLRRRQLAG
jgi:hypothetical protein